MSKYIYIKVDTNDADYVGTLSKISDESLNKIMPLIEEIKNFKPYMCKHNRYTCSHNYPFGELKRSWEKSVQELYPNISEEVFELFEDYIHYTEFGFHSVNEIMLFGTSPKTLL